MRLGAAEPRRRHFWRKPASPARSRREKGEDEVGSAAGALTAAGVEAYKGDNKPAYPGKARNARPL